MFIEHYEYLYETLTVGLARQCHLKLLCIMDFSQLILVPPPLNTCRTRWRYVAFIYLI